ncbi:hypothetical protein HID58_042126 [Brassica napus]|uniref:F-box associated beta-propeller type 1 domain-containing protein n=1 Tax=Brassica napus TaxID=3708 RepID=A0ABQ8BD17_BRANA|nr:hypothetical protein HID58_042126 [Brassica napus]
MKMSDLPRELAEEALCRIPVTSLRPVRSTCKKCGVFAKKHLAHHAKVAEEAKEDPVVVMIMDYRVFLMRFNLSNINNNVESCVNPEAKLIGPDGSDQIDVREIFHCDGLLLCIPKDHSRLVVWNPYWGQTRWIECTHNYRLQPNHLVDKYTYALGYDSSSSSHKILRFSDFATMFVEFRIYEFSSDSWRILDLLPRVWMIGYGERGLTLKGNTYWFASEIQFKNSFLVCFDFTRETFWSHLPLPFDDAYPEDTVSLSSVREDQLVEKKIAVVFAKDTDIQNPTREVAYIIGVDGSIKAADVRESADKVLTALVCSYVPSLSKIGVLWLQYFIDIPNLVQTSLSFPDGVN